MAGSHRARGVGADNARTTRGRRRRRSRRSRRRIAAITVVSFLVLVTSGAGWMYLQLDGNIRTFGTDGVSGDRPDGGAGGQNVLVIGSDSRSGGNSQLGGGSGDVGRSDTAFLLHVYADRKHAAAVSFPRDALVDIPSCKRPDGGWTRPQHDAMFNSAFTVGNTADGNPACTQNTVEQLTGLRVDHTVVVDFAGFSRMTSAVGGVPVCVPNDVYQNDINPNRASRGSRIFAKGKQTVSGQRALDYVRLRHGIGDGSDIGRIQRQQAFVGSLIKKIKNQGFSPDTLLPLAKAATESMTVDEELGSANRMVSFAMQLKNVDLHNTRFVTLPWRYQGARVAVVDSEAQRLWSALKADKPLPGDGNRGGAKGGNSSGSSHGAHSGKGVRVAVQNGTTVTGLAARAAGSLRTHSFTVTHTGTDTSAPDRATTRISHGPGDKAGARKVAQRFPGAKLTATSSSGITVTLGQDYADKAASGSPDGGKAGRARSANDSICSGLSYG